MELIRALREKRISISTDTVKNEFWDAYMHKCLRTHKGNKEKCCKLRLEYADTMHYLFGSHESLDAHCQSSRIVTFESRTLTFVPSLIDSSVSTKLQQCDACLTMACAWQNSDSVSVVIDLTDVTSEFLRDIMARTTKYDIVHGIRLWTTLPCKYDSIHIMKPHNTPMLSTLIAIATRALPRKLRMRVTTETPK